jgi:energy-coupling factor transporter ATP-binding protein EcfA2
LLQNRDKLVEQLKEYKDVDKALIENRNRQSDILLEYSDLMKKRISERKRVIDIWNCNSGLRVSLITFGNLEDNEKAFRNMIMKTGSTFSNDILKMDGDDVYCGGIIYDIANPKDNNKIVDELRNKFDKIVNVDSSIMGKSIEKHLKSIFENKPEICDEIMTWIPDDKVVLELKMSNNRYVKIDAGSAGQRTSAILALLLQISDTPLIIDQPEDDLDTKNISEFVVKGINNKKRNQQIIVVTHNPNIVVNTNSEQIIHMEYGGGEINASHSGALQELEIRDAICDVMEGGREALDARYYRISKALLK